MEWTEPLTLSIQRLPNIKRINGSVHSIGYFKVIFLLIFIVLKLKSFFSRSFVIYAIFLK